MEIAKIRIAVVASVASFFIFSPGGFGSSAAGIDLARGLLELRLDRSFPECVLALSIALRLSGLVKVALCVGFAGVRLLLELVDGAVLEGVTNAGVEASSECDHEIEKHYGDREAPDRMIEDKFGEARAAAAGE